MKNNAMSPSEERSDVTNLDKLKAFGRRHWFPISGFVLSAACALWFGFTFLAETIYFNDPRHQNADLKRWMTPHYVVLSYDLPPPVVFEALGVDPWREGRPLHMGRIAQRQGISLEELTQRVRMAAERYREDKG